MFIFIALETQIFAPTEKLNAFAQIKYAARYAVISSDSVKQTLLSKYIPARLVKSQIDFFLFCAACKSSYGVYYKTILSYSCWAPKMIRNVAIPAFCVLSTMKISCMIQNSLSGISCGAFWTEHVKHDYFVRIMWSIVLNFMEKLLFVEIEQGLKWKMEYLVLYRVDFELRLIIAWQKLDSLCLFYRNSKTFIQIISSTFLNFRWIVVHGFVHKSYIRML